MENKTNDEILFQRIMSSKAYRRGMILYRCIATAIVAGGLASFCVISIVLGILLAVMAIAIGIIIILASLSNEYTYTVYDTRLTLKRRGDYGRKTVPLDSVVAVKYKSAFYEKNLCVGTITVKAKIGTGKVKSCKLKHIFDARPILEFLEKTVNGRKTDGGTVRE